MKKTLFLLLLSFQLSYSQFGIINDVDGYVNVRSTAQKGNNISDKLQNGSVVYYFEPQGNWVSIDYKKNGKECNGYIYKDRIKYITDFKNVPLKSTLTDKVILENEIIKVEIATTPFIKANHKLKFVHKDSNIVEKIDGRQVFGTDGGIPKTQYKFITFEINKTPVEIPQSALQNLYEPNLYNSKANYDAVNDILYLQSSNSDGAGGYEIVWIIEKKKFKTRIEAYGF